jgi:hypothetical protein
MTTDKFRILEPGQGETLPFPLLENLTADERERADVFSSESFGEIFAAENPMILWAVFLTCTKLDGKSYGSMGRARLPRDEVKRLACLHYAKNMLPVGAIWLNITGDQFRYALLELPLRLWPKERNEKLLEMIHQLLKIEFGDPGTLVIDNAFE